MVEFTKAVDQNLQNKINKSIVFNYLREHQPVSRTSIAKGLKVSASAVTRIVNDLIKKGYMLEHEKKVTSAGRRPTLMKINSNMGCVVSLDLSQASFKVSINNFTCEVLKRYKSFKITNNTNIVDSIITELHEILDQYSKKKLQFKNLPVKAFSLGIPADVNNKTGEIISASLYKSWYSINFKNLLENEFKVPVFLEKDVHLSVLAEKHFGEGKEFSDIVFVEISNGVGSGIMINNKILRGNTMSAGQISFMELNEEINDYKPGDIGCLDKYASFQSFKKNLIRRIEKGDKSIILDMVSNDLNSIRTNLIFEAAHNGDKLCRDVILEISDLLAKAIVNLILILNPQIIIIGGNITNCAKVEEIFIDRIRGTVKRVLPIASPPINLSKLRDEVVLVGASVHAIDLLLYDIFPYKI